MPNLTVSSIEYEKGVNEFIEKYYNIPKYNIFYSVNNSMKDTDSYKIPLKHYFFMGDNRDCSKDSRFLSSVGYVHKDNLVGKAQFLFFSNDSINSSSNAIGFGTNLLDLIEF